MTLLSILLNKRTLNIKELTSNDFEYLENFIDYKLAPFKQLAYFRYNTFSRQHIDGQSNPLELIVLLQKHINNAFFPINHFLNLPTAFYNPSTNSFFISTTELEVVKNNPEEYCIFFSHLYH